MKQLSVNIPDAKVTYNYLYENMPFDWREEDLLFVSLPNGRAIDVGWYPACDPNGQFKITLSDRAQNQIKVQVVNTLEQVVSAVEGMAAKSKNDTSRETSFSIEYHQQPFPQNSVHAMSSATTSAPFVIRPSFLRPASVA